MKLVNSTTRKIKGCPTKASVLLLVAFCAVDVYAQGIPTMSGPGGASGGDPFALAREIVKWIVTFVGYGLSAFIFLIVGKNTMAKYNDMGEEGSRTTWRDVLAQGIGGMAIVMITVALTTIAIGVFGEATI